VALPSTNSYRKWQNNAINNISLCMALEEQSMFFKTVSKNSVQRGIDKAFVFSYFRSRHHND
jgi:hypothetical protein